MGLACQTHVSSTAEDLLTYAHINMNEIKPYLRLCHQKHASSKKHDMGLGWIMQKNNNNVLWHNGGTGAFKSFLGFNKQKKIASVVLSNYFVNTEIIGLNILEN